EVVMSSFTSTGHSVLALSCSLSGLLVRPESTQADRVSAVAPASAMTPRVRGRDWVIVLLRSGFPVPRHRKLAEVLDQCVQRYGGQADHDDAGDGQRCLQLLTGGVGQAADAGDAGVQLGGDHTGPREAGGDPDAGDDL